MRVAVWSFPPARYELFKEVIRKALHLVIAFVPLMARWNMPLTVVFLSLGILFYIACETARVSGMYWGLVNHLTRVARRPTERGFVWGPVSLGFGALIALIFYPSPAATLAIFSLAFGDGLAGLAGKIWGRNDKIWVGGKSFAGSLACFLAVVISAQIVLQDPLMALATAVVATILELIPEYDNFVIPLGTGLVMTLLLRIG